MRMQILLSANTLIEFFLNRSKFINEVEYVSKIVGSNSSIQVYLAKPGLDKIAIYLKGLNGSKISKQQILELKKRIKILHLTIDIAQKALSSAIDYESAVEMHLAIEAGIGAIVT